MQWVEGVMMSEYKYKFKFPVGDWSGDGHEKCYWYVVESNYTVKSWREAYFKSKEKFPNLAPDHLFDKGWPLHKMREATGFQFPTTDYDWEPGKEKDIPKVGFPSDEDIVAYTLTFCQLSNPKLKYRVVPDDVDMFPFYGFDKKGRHISHIGYDKYLNW